MKARRLLYRWPWAVALVGLALGSVADGLDLSLAAGLAAAWFIMALLAFLALGRSGN